MPLQSWCWRNSSLAAFCQPPLSGITPAETYAEYTKSQRKYTLVIDALLFSVPCEEEERMGTFCGFTESWLTPQSWLKVFVLWKILSSNKKTEPNLIQNSSVNMNKVTQLVSTILQWGYKCFWLWSQKAIDSRCSVLWVCLLLDSTLLACMCLSGCGLERTESRAWDEVVQTTAWWCTVRSLKAFQHLWFLHTFWWLICRQQPLWPLDGGVYFQKGATLPMHINTKSKK